MLPLIHIFLSIILSLILFLLNMPFWQILVIFFSSILIDIDHYFLYISLRKDINLKNAILFYINEGKKYENNKKYQFAFLQVFHTIEFFLFLLIFSFFNRIALLIFMGCMFHMCTDLVEHVITKHVYLKSPSLFFRRKIKI